MYSCPTAGKNGTEFMRKYTLEVTLDARDASAKYIYSKLFSWIIAKINSTLASPHENLKLIKQISMTCF